MSLQNCLRRHILYVLLLTSCVHSLKFPDKSYILLLLIKLVCPYFICSEFRIDIWLNLFLSRLQIPKLNFDCYLLVPRMLLLLILRFHLQNNLFCLLVLLLSILLYYHPLMYNFSEHCFFMLYLVNLYFLLFLLHLIMPLVLTILSDLLFVVLLFFL